MIKLDFIILLLVFIVILLGLPILFLYILLKKVYQRFSDMEDTIEESRDKLSP